MAAGNFELLGEILENHHAMTYRTFSQPDDMAVGDQGVAVNAGE